MCVETLLKTASTDNNMAISTLNNVAKTLRCLHKTGMVHGDATTRNVFINLLTHEVMWIDFLY